MWRKSNSNSNNYTLLLSFILFTLNIIIISFFFYTISFISVIKCYTHSRLSKPSLFLLSFYSYVLSSFCQLLELIQPLSHQLSCRALYRFLRAYVGLCMTFVARVLDIGSFLCCGEWGKRLSVDALIIHESCCHSSAILLSFSKAFSCHNNIVNEHFNLFLSAFAAVR